MCGRYNVTPNAEAFLQAFDIAHGLDSMPAEPLFNVAPSSKRHETRAPIVRLSHRGGNALVMSRWPLTPFWAKEKWLPFSTANAKGETVSQKPAFRQAWRRRQRCLIPAHGYYEWQATGTQRNKQPYHIKLGEARLFAFGGLWDRWRDSEGDPTESFTIITTDPAPSIKHIHSRMPLIIGPPDYERWLTGDPEDTETLIVPWAGEPLVARPVSTLVNNPMNNDPRCIEPLAPVTQQR